MSWLIGQSLYGNTFVQDPIPEYIKIDNVTVDETPGLGYTVVYGDDITALLKDCLKDSNIVAVVYHWGDGVAYTKTGIGSAAGAKNLGGYTTFIAQDRVGAPHTPSPHDSFVYAQGTDLFLNGSKFVPVGFNAFYLGLMQETMNWPTNPQITEAFEVAKKMNATTIRSHTLGFSAQSEKSLLDYSNNFNNPAWAPIDWAFAEARRFGIKLVIVLTDPYEYYHGSYKTFCSPYNIPKDQFFTSPIARDNFKQYVFGYLNHINPHTGIAIKNCTDVAFFELGNELGNYRPDAGSTALPTQSWITEITKHIQSMSQILVLNGSDECINSSTSNDFLVTELDCHSRHFYWEDYNMITNIAQKSSDVGKPFIIGEYSSRFGDNWYRNIEQIYNVKGSFCWSLYPHKDGTQWTDRIYHGDGFDFWYDNYTSENNTILKRLKQHFERMRGFYV